MKTTLKTREEILNTPSNKVINVINYEDYTCPFCGKHLHFETVGFGRNKCRQYYPCNCELAQIAEAHNAKANEIGNKDWSKKVEEMKQKQDEELRRKQEEEAKKPILLSQAELVCAYTGCILPELDATATHDKVSSAMTKAGIKDGELKERVKAYAVANNFFDELDMTAKCTLASKDTLHIFGIHLIYSICNSTGLKPTVID